MLLRDLRPGLKINIIVNLIYFYTYLFLKIYGSYVL